MTYLISFVLAQLTEKHVESDKYKLKKSCS